METIRAIFMGIRFLITGFVFSLLVMKINLTFFTIFLYRQLRLIYITNYHGIYHDDVYKLLYTSMRNTTNAEKVYLLYGEYACERYMDFRNSLVGAVNFDDDIVSVTHCRHTKLAKYTIIGDSDTNMLMKYIYTIIENRVHKLALLASCYKDEYPTIKNMISYYGTDAYKRSVNIII